MSFAYPFLIALVLVLLPLAVWGLAHQGRRRRSQLDEFGESSLLARASALTPQPSRATRQSIRLAALSLGALALARPQLGERPASLAHTGRDVLVVLDLSRSMNAADVEPPASRLDIARRAILEVLAASPGHRVGLVVFGGSAFLQLPLTADHATFERFLAAASTDDLANPATDLSRALATAATAFEHDGERGYQTVLLVSDGGSGEADMAPPLGRLQRSGVPVLALGVGGIEGAPIPADSSQRPEQWHRDHIGRVVQTRLVENDLRRAARETNGIYLRWTAGAGKRLGGDLARLEKRAMSSRTSTERADRFQWPLGLAVVLLAMDPLLGIMVRGRRKAFLFTCMVVWATGCSPALRESRRAERLYEAGQFRESHEAFQRAIAGGGEPALHLAAGNSLYRMRRYEEASRSFREALSVPRLRQRAYYNLGNAYVRVSEEAAEKQEPLRLAIAAYEEALRLEPRDSLAKWNLELALQRWGADRESGGSSGRGRSAQYGRGNMDVPGYEGTPEAAVGAMAGGGYGSGEGESAEELSEAQARQLLEAVQREQLSSHQGRQAGRSGSGQFDW